MFVFLISLLVGSFIGMLTYRLPRRIAFIFGRSFCDSCKKELRWYDNIPLVSFLLYQGNSRCCNKKIGLRYPLIELLFALSAFLLFIFVPDLSLFIFYYILLILTASILIIDLEYQIIPDELVWALLLFSLIINHESLITMLFPGFLFALLLLIIHFITKGRGMGLGDVKLVIPLAAIVGIEKLYHFILWSFLIGGIVALILLLLGRARLKTKIAFGPFIIIAFWISLIFI